MDLLFSKYSNPMILINGMIKTKRLHEFVQEFIRIHNEEKNEKAEWEFFLHKVFDKSFSEFKSSIDLHKTEINKEEVAIAMVDSKNLLNEFVPES